MAAFAMGSASAEVAVTASFVPGTTQVGGTSVYRVVITSSENVALSNLSLTQAISGAQGLDIAGATSSCGGSFSGTGNTFSWSGGSLAEPAANSNTSCTLNVTLTTNNTPNSYTTTIPAGGVTNDQGRSNTYAGVASFNVTPLIAPTLWIKTAPETITGNNYNLLQYDGNIPSAYSWYNIGGAATQHPGVQINNFNNTPLHLDGSKLYVPAGLTNPDLSRCTGSTLTSMVAGPSTNAPVNLNGTMTADLVIPAGGCIITFETVPAPPKYSGDSTTGSNEHINFQEAITYPSLLIGTSREDASLNGKMLYINGSPRIPQAIAIHKEFNGQNSYSTSGNADANITLNLEVGNAQNMPHSVNLTDQLPTFGDYSASTISVRSRITPNNESPACTTQGASISSGGLFTLANTVIPKNQSCIFDVTFKVPAGSWSGSWVNTIPGSAVSTDFSGPSSETVVTRATFNLATEGAATKVGMQPIYNSNLITGAHLNFGWWKIEIQNTYNAQMQGLSFTDEWGQGLKLDLSKSYSTCGGSITPTATGEGANFSGGTIARLATCQIVFAITPASVKASNIYTNAIPAMTTTSGHSIQPSGPGATMRVIYRNGLTYSQVATSAAVNSTTPFSFVYYNYSDFDLPQKEFQITLDPTMSFPQRDWNYYCYINNVIINREVIPYSNISINGQVATFKIDVPKAGRINGNGPIDQQQAALTTCFINGFETSSTAGQKRTTITTQEPDGNGLSNINSTYMTMDYQAAPTFTINKTASPQTVYAGGIVNYNITSPTSTDNTVTGPTVPFRVEDRLPDGIEAVTTGFTKLPDGYYVKKNNIFDQVDSACDQARTCQASNSQLITPDLKTVISYMSSRSNSSNFDVKVLKPGQLTNTIRSTDTAPTEAASSARIIGDTSVSVTVLPSIVVEKSFSKSSAQPGEEVTMSIKVTNANSIPAIITVSDPLSMGYIQPVSPITVGGCSGATGSVTGGTLKIDGISLNAGESCTATIQMIVSNPTVSAQTLINTIQRGGAQATNLSASNQFATSATLSIAAGSACIGLASGQAASTTITSRSPGTASDTVRFTNTGNTTTSVSWSRVSTNLMAISYSFDGQAANGDITTAWNNRVSALGNLAAGGTTQLTRSYTLGQLPVGSTVTSTVGAQSTTAGSCSVNQTTNINIVRGSGQASKTQAICSAVNGQLSCGPQGTAAIQASPCDIVRYQVIGTNSGTASLLKGKIEDSLPSGLIPGSFKATSSSGSALVWSSDGTTWNSLASGGQAALAGPSIKVGYQQGGTLGDLPAGEAITLELTGQVAGQNCPAIPALP